MSFRHYIPCDALKPYVKQLAISENAEESLYKVLPDTGLVMGFQFKGSLFHILDGKRTQLSRSGITGLMDKFRLFQNSAGIGTVLVYLQDGAASNFLRVPIHELFQNSVSLDNFLLQSEVSLLEERLYEVRTDLEKIDIVEQFLISQIKPARTDALVAHALNLIYQHKGDIRIGALSDQLNISQSPLEKRFRKVVGTSPKKFASIVRFRDIIKNVGHASSHTAQGYDAGFYDQAHFIKEFRKFAGDTPIAYFRTK